jgi:hypothetical protein
LAFERDLAHAMSVGIGDDRRDETVISGNRNANVDVGGVSVSLLDGHALLLLQVLQLLASTQLLHHRKVKDLFV